MGKAGERIDTRGSARIEWGEEGRWKVQRVGRLERRGEFSVELRVDDGATIIALRRCACSDIADIFGSIQARLEIARNFQTSALGSPSRNLLGRLSFHPHHCTDSLNSLPGSTLHDLIAVFSCMYCSGLYCGASLATLQIAYCSCIC